jgi:DNA-binding beta-propeller fold protein YncE
VPLGVLGRTALASEPHGIAFGAGYVWVALYHQSRILRFDPRTGRVDGQPIDVPFPPEPMAAAGGTLWAIPSAGGALADPSLRAVVKIDAKTGRRLETFHTRGRPRAVVATPGGAWVATSGPNRLLRLGA